MPGCDIVVIGASAGGMQVVKQLLAGLPGDLPAALFVVIHTAAEGPGILAQILDRAGPLRATHARDGEDIVHGRVYVAPPDHHMLLKRGLVRLTRGPRENGFRPAVDPLFRTAAQVYGPRAVGIILSGSLDDGTLGSACIKQSGGVAMAQLPEEALFPSMPASVVRNVELDYVLAVQDMPARITQLAYQEIGREELIMAEKKPDAPDVAEEGTSALRDALLNGPPSPFTCPDCGGATWRLQDHGMVHYRCHVGHGFTAQSMRAMREKQLDEVLWSGIRMLEEQAEFLRQLALSGRPGADPSEQREHEKEAACLERRARKIRSIVTESSDEEASQSAGKQPRNRPARAKRTR